MKLCLIVMGSKEILAFNIAILIGLIAGLYSSVLMSASIWLFFENKMTKRRNAKNKKNSNKPKKKKVEELSVKGINA